MNERSQLVIRGLDVELRRICEDDLELLRTWRNDPEVRRYMVFQDPISAEAQARWYATLDKQSNYYFVLHYDGCAVGLSHIKNIDWTARTAEAGIFLVPQSARNSLIAYRTALPGADFTFDELKLEYVTAATRRDNRRAIRFNLSMGHVFEPDDQAAVTLRSRLTRDAYLEKRKGFEGVFGPFETEVESENS